MIAYLKGKIISKSKTSCIICVGDVGYKVFLPKRTISEISPAQTKEFFTFNNIREDTNDLYGFQSGEELEIFELLLCVSGVGPKVAMTIVSELGYKKILSSISANDPSIFKTVAGVGTRVAQKIVVDLRSKVSSGSTGEMPEDDETFEALCSLGYKKEEASSMIRGLPDGLKTVQQKVRYALKYATKSKKKF